MVDTIKLNPHHITELKSLSFPIDKSLASAVGSIIGCGTSAAPLTCGTVAGAKFMSIYAKSEAVSGDARLLYARLYIAGIGGAGEAVRAYTTIQGVAAVGTVNGIHASLDFADADSKANGSGYAARCTLHIPSEATWTSGTLAAIMAEIYSDGAASDPDGVTELSFIRFSNGGNTTGAADVDTDAFLFSLQDFTAGTGSLVYDHTGTDPSNSDGSIKIKIGANTRYLMYYDQQAA